MKKLFFGLLMVALCASYCSKKSSTNKDTYEYFSANLNAGMNYSEIVNLFGEPSGDKGSGIHIYVYDLSDGTAVWIGYTNQILYARHVSSTGQVLHTII